MVIQEAAEMYLETILRLKNKIGVVRAVDYKRADEKIQRERICRSE